MSTPANPPAGLWGTVRSQLWGPHSYDTRHQIYARQGDEDLRPKTEAAIQALQRGPAPGFGGRATPEGSRFFAAPVGMVTSTTTESGVQNKTIEGEHALHPGTVDRTIETDDQSVYVRSKGTGEGLLPKVNEKLASAYWGYAARNLRKQLNPEQHAQPFSEAKDPMGIFPPRDDLD